MPVNNQVVIDIKAQFQNLGKAEMITALKDLQSGLENLKTTNQQGTQAWDDQKSKILGASQAISGYSRELKGLEPNVQRTSDSLLNMGKNLTVLVAGIEASIGQVIEFGKKIGEMALKGAEITEMRNYFNEMNGGLTLATEKFEGLKQASNFKLSDEDILRFTNRMDDLGYSTTETTQLMDLSERKSDELGISINESALKFTQFIETGRGRGLYKIGVDVGAVNDKIKEMTGLTSAQLKEMDATDQQTIRKNAVLALYGKSLDEINSKQRTTESVLMSVGVAFENAKLKIGSFISETIGKLAQAFGLTSEKMASVIVVSALAVGAIMAISAAVIGLTIAFSALNIVSGGILIGLGILVALISGFTMYSMLNQTDESTKKLNGFNTELKKTDDNIKKLESIKNIQFPLPEKEQKEYNDNVKEMIALYPNVVSGIDSYTNSLIINNQKLQESIDLENKKRGIIEKRIDETLNEQLNKEVWAYQQANDAIVPLNAEYEKSQKAIEDLTKAKDNLLTSYQNGNITQQDYLNGLKGLDNAIEIAKFQQDGYKTKLDESIKTSQGFPKVLKEIVQNAFNLGKIPEVLQNLTNHFGNSKQAAMLLQNAFGSIGIAGILGLQNFDKALVEQSKFLKAYTTLFEKWNQAMAEGKTDVAQVIMNVMSGLKDQALSEIKKLEKAPSYTPKGKKEKTEKDETKLSEEEQILKLLQDQIAVEKEKGTLTIAFLNLQKDKYKDIYDSVRQKWLDDPSNPDKAKSFESMKKAMELLSKETESVFKQTLESIKNTINPTFEQISTAQDEVLKQIANTTNEETKNGLINIKNEYDKLADNLGKDDVARHQKYMKDRETAQKDITKNMYDWENNLIEDKYEKERKLIEDKYTFEQNELDKQLKAGTIEKWQYDKASGLLKKNKEKDTPTWINEFSDKMNGITSNFSSALGKLSIFFGEKGGEFINTLVDGFNRISAIVTIITDMIQTAKAVSSFLSMLLPGGGGGVAGKAWATGGYLSGMGTGTSDSIPAWLSNGEYVINAKSTSMYLPLLNAINGGNPYTTIAKYANGGLVNRSNLNSNVRLEVADVKLKGSDLHLSWRRQDRLETDRKG